MRRRVSIIVACAFLCLASTASWAQLAPYEQDFEGLVQADPAALANDGWLVFGNVFNPDWSYAGGYGPFPAPNGGSAFSAIDAGQGGPEQGAQQLSVYNDYNNWEHGNGKYIEANVFQEQIIGAADVGATWLFEFDAKRGNIAGGTTALAFFKTLHPTQFWLSRFIVVDMTNVPESWDSYSLAIPIDPDIEGHIFQFGFLSTATNYEGSGIFYDNVVFRQQPLSVSVDIRPGSCPNPIYSRAKGVLPAAILGTGNLDVGDIDVDSVRLEGVAPVQSSYEDVVTPFEGEACGCTEAGADGNLDLTLKFKLKDLLDALGPLQAGYHTLTLTGTLLDGTPFEGVDCVVVVGGGRGGRGGQGGQVEPPDDSNTLGSGSGSSTTFGR